MNLLRNGRYLLLSLVAIGALAIFAACGGDDEGDGGGEDTATPGGDESPAAGERIDGGTLRVHYVATQSTDPHFSSFAQDIGFQRFLWRGLYSMDTENVPQPAMAAADPEISEDGLTVTVTLKDGLLWSDGDDLLAEDFVLGIQRTCNPVNAGEYQYLLANVAGCDDYFNALSGPDGDPGTADDLDPATADLTALQEGVGAKAIDDTTIEFTLLNPGPTFQTILSLWMTFPIPIHLFPDPGATWPAGEDLPTTLAFNGPYVLTEFTQDASAAFEPNPNWKAEYSPIEADTTLDGIEMTFITDHAQATRAFENDELDTALADLTQLQSLVSKYEPTNQYLKLVRPATRGLEMNLDHPPLDNLDVRLAIGKAVDWQSVIDNCFEGGHEYTTTWIPESVDGGQPTDAYLDTLAYDVDAAKQLLADSGVTVDRSLVMIVSNAPEFVCTAEAIQEQIRTNLGIESTVEPLERSVRSARFREETFDLFPGGWIQDYPDPENWVLGQFDEPGVGLNHYNCDNQEIQDLVAEHEFNLDNDARIAGYERINEIISTEVCGVFPYYHEAEHYLEGENVVGTFENATGQDAVYAGDWACEGWGLTE